ncbi:MAG: ribonuclease P protein component [Nitrospirota bacterium]|nr:ribonuclease P protein component [Nitrospirota bacterium]
MLVRFRDLRLARSADISRVFRSGQRLQTPFFRVIYQPNGLSHPRFCVPVSRKVSRRAVGRNRIRRRTREALRPLLASSSCGVDLVVLPTRSVAELAWPEVIKHCRLLVERILPS